MNKKITTLFLTGVLAVSSLSIVYAAPKKAGQGKGLVLSKGQYVIEQKQADVNGDKIEDTVFLIGEKDKKEDIYNKNIMVKVVDGKKNQVKDIKFKDFGGYEGELFLGDFTGDKVSDIMVTTSTGGSGGIVNTRIATIKDNKVKEIFKEEDNQGLNFTGEFVDGFKAELKDLKNNEEIILDVSAFKDMYVEGKIYDKDGKLLEKVEPWTDPFSMIDAVDMDGDGVYELKGYQKISGSCHANTISRINTIWKYENEKWNIKEADYSTFLK